MRPDERRRERWILLHIVLMSCLALTGTWGYFGVLPSPGAVWVSYWYGAYRDAPGDDGRFDALRHLTGESGSRAERVFSHAFRSGSSRLRSLAEDWFSRHPEAVNDW